MDCVSHSRNRTIALIYALTLGLWLNPALAEIRVFWPLTGYWDVPGNWSLPQVPGDGDSARIGAGGANIKTATYRNSNPYIPLLTDIRIDGSDTAIVTLYHPQDDLYVQWLYVGYDYRGYYSLGDGYLDVSTTLYLGRHPSSHGSFEMLTSGGTCDSRETLVGYEGTGEFHQINGTHNAGTLVVAYGDDGTYELQNGTLNVANEMVVGRAAPATFTQTGGAVNQTSSTYGVTIGLYSSGSATYTMSDGTLSCRNLSIANDGDGFFTQTGGDVTVLGDLVVGDVGSHPYQAWYKISEADASSSLHVGGNLLVAETSPAKYEQTGGDVTIDGSLEIWSGGGSSWVYLGTSAGTMGVSDILNHTGYYDQDGGIVTTNSFTNDSTQGVNLDNNADLRTKAIDHNAGTFWMWRNAKIKGPLAIPPNIYWLCRFTNDATFQMGSVASNGGTFTGELTNNGTFNYYQGDFSGSTLINYGTFNNNAPFTCKRLVNYANVSATQAHPITAGATGYANGIENHGNLSVYPGGTVTLTAGQPLVNDGNLYAGGTLAQAAQIQGNVTNDGYMLPSVGAAIGLLNIGGNFTNNPGAELRIRLGGTTAGSTYDRVAITGTANLGGELDVRLVSGYVPQLGDNFTVLTWGGYTGDFNPVYLPALPNGWQWCRNLSASGMTLTVCQASTQIVATHVFYNNSYYDGNSAALNAADNGAIDPSKALLVGGTSSFANYTGFTRGINGLMFDVANTSRAPVQGDFTFQRMGYDANTPGATAIPSAFAVVVGGGDSGSDRVKVAFADGSIIKTWLKITVGTGFGLSSPAVFWFGNQVGECNSPASGRALVNATDFNDAKNPINAHGPFNRAPVDDWYDINKDSLVNATDLNLIRADFTGPFNSIYTPITK